MVSTQSILVVAVIDRDLDRHGRVDQANDGGGNADKVCVAAVGGTCKPETSLVLFLFFFLYRSVSPPLPTRHLPGNVRYKTTSHNKDWLLLNDQHRLFLICSSSGFYVRVPF